jgi:hypothetical protein
MTDLAMDMWKELRLVMNDFSRYGGSKDVWRVISDGPPRRAAYIGAVLMILGSIIVMLS